MPESTVFKCPSCGATVETDGQHVQEKCPFCGSQVTVPAELRTSVPPPPKVVVINRMVQEMYTPTVTTRGGLSGLIFAVVLIVLGSVLYLGFGDQLAALIRQATGGAVDPPALTGGADLTLGGEGTGAGLFQGGVEGLAVDANGTIYASDDKTLRVQIFGSDGKFVNSWTIGEATGNKAQGAKPLVVDRNGHLYTIWQGVLYKFDAATGKLVARLGGGDLNGYYYTLGLLPNGNLLTIGTSHAAASQETLFVLDPNTGKVLKQTPKLISDLSDESIAAFWIYPAADGLGNLFVLVGDPTAPFVYQFTSAGKFVNKFGGKGDKAGQFNFPFGLAIDNQSRVYVADSGVKIFDPQGTFLKKVTSGAYVNARAIALDSQNRILLGTYDNQILRFAAIQ